MHLPNEISKRLLFVEELSKHAGVICSQECRYPDQEGPVPATEPTDQQIMRQPARHGRGHLYFSPWKRIFDYQTVFVGIKTDRNIEAVQEQDARNTAQAGKTRKERANPHRSRLCLSAREGCSHFLPIFTHYCQFIPLKAKKRTHLMHLE